MRIRIFVAGACMWLASLPGWGQQAPPESIQLIIYPFDQLLLHKMGNVEVEFHLNPSGKISRFDKIIGDAAFSAEVVKKMKLWKFQKSKQLVKIFIDFKIDTNATGESFTYTHPGRVLVISPPAPKLPARDVDPR